MEQSRMLRSSLDDKSQSQPTSSLEFAAPLSDTKPSLLPSYPPPSYSQAHDAATLSFPAVPTTELPPIQPPSAQNDPSNNTLPSLSAVTGSQPQSHFASPASSATEPAYSPPARPPVAPIPSLNPYTTYYAHSHAQDDEPPMRMDVDTSSTGTVSAASPDRHFDGRASSVSLDDPDVRMAADALRDLSTNFISSPTSHNTPLPGSPRSAAAQGQEPLLSLITTTHPIIAKTIEGTTSAYNNSKNYSSRFRSSAEYIESKFIPLGNTIGSVGRRTGVEGRLRTLLGGGKRRQHSSSDLETGSEGSHKRRIIDASEKVPRPAGDQQGLSDPYAFTKDRRLSQSTVDTLPVYDDQTSPAYTETADNQPKEHGRLSSRPSSAATAAWQQRFMVSTSALSIAMSEESLRSLKYCLNCLRWANEHIAKMIDALKASLQQFDQTAQSQSQNSEDPVHSEEQGSDTPMGDTESQVQDRNAIAARIVHLKGEVLKTLRGVIETVSKYAGGALPENARLIVHSHLTSLPQRFRLASRTESATVQDGQAARDKETRESAYKILLLANEGLGMMASVSQVMDQTVVQAEAWCERLGKKKREERQQLLGGAAEPPADTTADGDVLMR